MSKIPAGVGPKMPQIVVLFGATGDLSQRKLLPGLFHLATAGFIPKPDYAATSASFSKR
jgi:glucose-6-phosphate 1-dehydrogenase